MRNNFKLETGFAEVLSMPWRQVTLAVAVLLAVASAGAQTAPSNAMTLTAPASPSPVKNAPFSADVITQYDRVLPNGNHIHRETHGKVFRDSQGRVRTETDLANVVAVGGSSRHITIQDPLQRVVIHLDLKTKTAMVRHLGDPTQPPIASKDSPAPSATGGFLRVAPAPGQSSGTSTTIPLQHPGTASRPNVTTESLGTKPIEGVSATGTKTTRVVQTESSEPIIAVTDSWFSRDLQMLILSDSDDGQSGHSVMKVVNIVRTEPSAQLFQIPVDYTIKDSNSATASVKH